MNNKRILYLSYDGMTDALGQSQVLPYLLGLSARGYEFTLISCEKPEAFAKGRAKIQSICDEASIDWRPLPYTKSPPMLSTLLDVRRMRALALRLHREKPFAATHCRSYVAALTGLWLKRKVGAKFLFDMRGFWANERVDGGLWRLNHPVYRAAYETVKILERRFLENADAIVSLTYAGRDEINRWGFTHTDITVIPCCVDTELFDPTRISAEDAAAAKKDLAIPDDAMVLGYVGSVGTWYELPKMMQFFRVWLDRHPNSIFLFVSLEERSTIMAEATAHGVPEANVRVHPSPRDAMPRFIACMTYALFFIKPAYSKTASSPVKQGELMAMGIPVLCNSGVGDSDRIVRDYGSGVLIERHTVEAYAAAIESLQARHFRAVEIRAGAIDYFDLQKGISSYESLYRALLA